RRLGRDSLQPARSAHPVPCQPADFLCHVGLYGRDRVVVVRRDPHDSRALRRAKPNWKHRPETDRHLPENVPGAALAEDALDPVHQLDRLDSTFEHGKEGPLAALVHRVFARYEADIRDGPGKLFAFSWAKGREDV